MRARFGVGSTGSGPGGRGSGRGISVVTVVLWSSYPGRRHALTCSRRFSPGVRRSHLACAQAEHNESGSIARATHQDRMQHREPRAHPLGRALRAWSAWCACDFPQRTGGGLANAPAGVDRICTTCVVPEGSPTIFAGPVRLLIHMRLHHACDDGVMLSFGQTRSAPR